MESEQCNIQEDNTFPYDCELCGGAYSRCGYVHDYCKRCVDCKFCQNGHCKCQECILTGHLESSCPGGKGCWESTVIATIDKNIELPNNLDRTFYGVYDGYGEIENLDCRDYIFADSNNIDIVKKNYKEEDHEFIIPVKLMCKTCFKSLYKKMDNMKLNDIEECEESTTSSSSSSSSDSD